MTCIKAAILVPWLLHSARETHCPGQEADVWKVLQLIPLHAAAPRPRWYTILYVQVIIAIGVGILIGYLDPKLGVKLKPLGDGFIALIKMMIAPVIFCTIVHGIASMGDLKKIGRVGVKTLFYFEAVSRQASSPWRRRSPSCRTFRSRRSRCCSASTSS